MSASRPRVAVLTGGANGIGRALTERLAGDGVTVAVLDVDDAEAVVDEVTGRGGRALGIRCDITDPAAIARAAAEIHDTLGSVDILVNNAGIYPPTPFFELDLDQWRQIMRVNLDAPFLLAQTFASDMRAAGWGRIVNIASAVLWVGTADCAAYQASKAGVIGLTRALAHDLGQWGITVNAIAPGVLDTATVRAMGAPTDVFVTRQAVKRPGQPGDLSGALAYLVSEDAAFITAQTILIDGGFGMH